MKDTSAEVEQIYRELLLARSPAVRLAMGADMFTTAKELALADLRRQGVRDLRAALFLRFYGTDFEPAECERILERLRALDAESPLPSCPPDSRRRIPAARHPGPTGS